MEVDVTCIGAAPARSVVVAVGSTRLLLDCGAVAGLHVARAGAAAGAQLAGTPATPPSPDAEQQHADVLLEAPGFELLQGGLDAALISSPSGLLGLPLLLRCGRMPPHLYATEACLSLGFHCALELLEAQQELEAQREPTASPPAPAEQQAPPASRLRKRGAAGAAQPSDTGRQQPVQAQAPAGAAAAGRAAASLYSEQELAAAIQAVTVVRFGQRIQLPGSDVEAVAAPSGAGIGTCCWLLETGGRRVAYVSEASFQPGHPRPLAAHLLEQPHALLLAPGAISTTRLPHPATALQRMRGCVVESLKLGGHVLVPLSPTGPAFDLIEVLAPCLAAAASGGQAPLMLYVGAAAAASLAAATTSLEYVTGARQARVINAAEAPFEHEALRRRGDLVVTPSLSSAEAQGALLRPCIIFVSAASLAAGAGAHLLEHLAQDARCLLLLAEAPSPAAQAWLLACLARLGFPQPEGRAAEAAGEAATGVAAEQAWQGMAMRVLCQPYVLTPPLHPTEVLRLAGEAAARQVVMFEADRALLTALPQADRAALSGLCLSSYAVGGGLGVPLPDYLHKLSLGAEVAAAVQLAPVGQQGVSVARLQGLLTRMAGGGWLLEPLHAGQPAAASLQEVQACNPRQQQLWGEVQLDALLAALQDAGFTWTSVRTEPATHSQALVTVLRVAEAGGEIRLEHGATEVHADTGIMRQKLLQCVLDQLHKLG